jgi:hypothetical protein
MSLARRARAAAWGSFLFFRKKEEVRLIACRRAMESTGVSVESCQMPHWRCLGGHHRGMGSCADVYKPCRRASRLLNWDAGPVLAQAGSRSSRRRTQWPPADLLGPAKGQKKRAFVDRGKAALRCKTCLASGKRKQARLGHLNEAAQALSVCFGIVQPLQDRLQCCRGVLWYSSGDVVLLEGLKGRAALLTANVLPGKKRKERKK